MLNMKVKQCKFGMTQNELLVVNIFKYHDGAESLMFELSKWIIATSHGTYIRTFVLYFHKSFTASYASKGFMFE